MNEDMKRNLWNKRKSQSQFDQDLIRIINSAGIDSDIGIPDYILANYIDNCLQALRLLGGRIYRHSGKGKKEEFNFHQETRQEKDAK